MPGKTGRLPVRSTVRFLRPAPPGKNLTRHGDEGWTGFGLSLLSEGNRVNLAVPLWQWGTYYESMLRHIRDKSFQAEYTASSKALNYYWGMSGGAVELRCSDKLPPSIRKLDEFSLILACGDLHREYWEFLVTMSNRPLLYVHGKHDEDHDRNPPEGCVCVDDQIYVFEGIRILGLGGTTIINAYDHCAFDF